MLPAWSRPAHAGPRTRARPNWRMSRGAPRWHASLKECATWAVVGSISTRQLPFLRAPCTGAGAGGVGTRGVGAGEAGTRERPSRRSTRTRERPARRSTRTRNRPVRGRSRRAGGADTQEQVDERAQTAIPGPRKATKRPSRHVLLGGTSAALTRGRARDCQSNVPAFELLGRSTRPREGAIYY